MEQEVIFPRLAETVAPIFDAERGKRLRYMRMALLMDQKHLGERFGVPQQQIAKLELGQIKIGRNPITLAQVFSVFGCATHHILFGLDSEKYNYQLIRDAYWKEKDRTKGDRTSTRLTKKQRTKKLRTSAYRRVRKPL